MQNINKNAILSEKIYKVNLKGLIFKEKILRDLYAKNPKI